MSSKNRDGEIPAGNQAEADRRRKYEELGVKLFALTPEDFNPIAASPRELLAYGYPARPDAVL